MPYALRSVTSASVCLLLALIGGRTSGMAEVAATPAAARGALPTTAQLDARFDATIKPFLKMYCFECHSGAKPEAELDLSTFTSMAAAVESPRWPLVLEMLETEEMPEDDAEKLPTAAERGQAVAWFQALRRHEITRNAGDPGLVLARRLNNAEYDYTIRDLTGVDIRPTREFPADPQNPAGFDNSGESLVMSPSLLKKYLAAARDVANHLYLDAGRPSVRAARDALGRRSRQAARPPHRRLLPPAQHQLRRLFPRRLALQAPRCARPAWRHARVDRRRGQGQPQVPRHAVDRVRRDRAKPSARWPACRHGGECCRLRGQSARSRRRTASRRCAATSSSSGKDRAALHEPRRARRQRGPAAVHDLEERPVRDAPHDVRPGAAPGRGRAAAGAVHRRGAGQQPVRAGRHRVDRQPGRRSRRRGPGGEAARV